ncbi:MAG: glucose 1-dehydrogenase [Planctomycetota bacterium]
MQPRFAGKIAVVTGGAQGLGKAVALRLASEGADVAAVDIKANLVNQTAEEIRSLGRRALACSANLARLAEIPPLLERIVAEFGRIDILVNAAGVLQVKPFLEVTEADWNLIMDVNQKSLVFLIQAVAARMIEQAPSKMKAAGRSTPSYGKIVNFSSISGRRGRELQVHYAASKAAVISITQSAALAFAPYNINVNAVAPGVIPTAMWEQNERERSKIFGTPQGKSMQEFIERIPLKRPGTPEDVAGAVVFLCSSDADYITGQTLNVDGGFEMD